MAEACEILDKHLYVPEPEISGPQTNPMISRRLRIVVPLYIRDTYSTVRRVWFQIPDDFIRGVQARATGTTNPPRSVAPPRLAPNQLAKRAGPENLSGSRMSAGRMRFLPAVGGAGRNLLSHPPATDVGAVGDSVGPALERQQFADDRLHPAREVTAAAVQRPTEGVIPDPWRTGRWPVSISTCPAPRRPSS